MSKKHDKMVEKVEALAQKMSGVLTEQLDALSKKVPEEAMVQVNAALVHAIVHRMVLDSLSVSKAEAKTKPTPELLKKVHMQFQKMRMALEESVGVAFELGVSQAVNKDSLFVCEVKSVNVPKESLPC